MAAGPAGGLDLAVGAPDGAAGAFDDNPAGPHVRGEGMGHALG